MDSALAAPPKPDTSAVPQGHKERAMPRGQRCQRRSEMSSLMLTTRPVRNTARRYTPPAK